MLRQRTGEKVSGDGSEMPAWRKPCEYTALLFTVGERETLVWIQVGPSCWYVAGLAGYQGVTSSVSPRVKREPHPCDLCLTSSPDGMNRNCCIDRVAFSHSRPGTIENSTQLT